MNTDSKSISQAFVALGALGIAIIVVVSMITDAQGALAALTPPITIALALLAFAKPRAGLFALIPLVIWVDEYKRLAVYFGGANSMTVIQTLAMPFIVLAALNAGYLVSLLFRKVKFEPIIIVFYAIAATVGLGVYFTMDGGMAEKGQRAANIAGYITLIPIAFSYLRTFDAWRKFFAYQVIWALPAALWAIKQYYHGFDQIEWIYARSGLSRVHSGQMLSTLDPRVFGFFGSASALGCVGIYCAFAWWHAFRHRKMRFFWLLVGALLSWVLILSMQRTALFYPLIVMGATFFFRTRLRTFCLYAFAGIVFLLGVINSDYLLEEGLDKINETITPDSGWGNRVFRVSTFSDRIRGWQRLKRAETYSLLGTGNELIGGAGAAIDVNSEDYNHDIINKILINVGVIGLLVLAVPGLWLLRWLHRSVYLIPDKRLRNDGAFALALALPSIGLSFIGGDNFNTNPINLQIWTAFAGVLILCGEAIRHLNAVRKESKAPRSNPDLLEAV